MSRLRVPSAVAVALGLVLVVSAGRLAGPKLPDGDRTDRGFVLHTAALVGGGLVALLGLAGLLRSAQR